MCSVTSEVYLEGLAECRSSLAALADGAVDEWAAYEDALIDLDELHHGLFPPIRRIGGSEDELLARWEASVERLIGLGGDVLGLEFCLDQLRASITG